MMESARKRKSAPEMGRSAMESGMRRRKLKALENHADFGFIVGRLKDEAELMQCFKSDLLAASDYFGGLLRSPSAENPPVWIKHIQPHIFKMILQFVSVQTVDDLSLEDAVALALAADEFLLELLKDFCASEINRLVTVKTVWTTLNSIVRIPDLPETCSQVLALKTEKCLEHESFLEASTESLIFLLKIETLYVGSELRNVSELDLIEAAIKLAKTKPEKEEVEMMKAVIPHLRLLTVPVDKLDPLAKYLSDCQMSYLAKRLVFKVDNAVPLGLNSSTMSRCRPVRDEKFKFDFISEDLIKSDWQMLGLEPKKSTTWNTLQITLVAAEHLVVKGIEILTRANTSPKTEFIRHKHEASSRICTIKEEYKEDLLVAVFVTLKGGEENNVFNAEVKGKKEYNSWFSVDFGKEVFVPKGAECAIDVRSANVYQFIPFPHIKENIDKAEKCAEFSEIAVNFFEQEQRGDKTFTPKSLEKDGEYFFCVKRLSIVPVDEQGCLDME